MKIKQSNFFTFAVDDEPQEKAIETAKKVCTAIKKDAETRARRCIACMNSRIVTSENGVFPICCLSSKKATLCLIGERDAYVSPSAPNPYEEEMK